MKIGIVGLGLIGGSIGLGLVRQLNVKVIGVDQNPQHCDEAIRLGLVHEIMQLDEVVRDADLIVLAIPVDGIEQLLPSILDNISDRTVVTDVGSTKANICTAVKNHPNRERYVASHPLAGTEFSGPSAALEGLYNGKKNIICEMERSSKEAIDLVKRVFSSLGMVNDYMTADAHDRHLAYVSHLSHISSFTLSLTVLDIEKDEDQIFNLASTGFASTVRLAKSSPQTWAPIFSKNKDHLSKALGQYIDRLQEFKSALDKDNRNASVALMEEANSIKRILKKG